MTQRPTLVRRQIAVLRQRDGDSCWLCLLPIDFGITDTNDPMRCSRDHVVPRALGGDSTVANMRLAHRRCNTERDQEPMDAFFGGQDAPDMPCEEAR